MKTTNKNTQFFNFFWFKHYVMDRPVRMMFELNTISI